ncbi:SGNH/GDSL hydrolase family protein [Microbacterium thalli]|uniref:SGNH/GDSL hydrolase family protein n=1 Tax=Microbacterium thalli TaxID=3027921 RepID=A0ABT5SKD1_9MICO|nr:SGNH/GDSL hydrolase family protein [Microbacterium thalli]MDD7963293.1 SGNH/GDSL hydrolase family protein [Microbacterium thalli]
MNDFALRSAQEFRAVWDEIRGTGEALIIGDSYSEGYRASSFLKRWSAVLCARMGWIERNYAVGGSGFSVKGSSTAVPGGRTFLEQAQQAKADGVNPAVIMVAGARNDGTTNVVALAQSFIAYLKANFPKARIIIIPGLWDATPPPQYLLDRQWDWRTAFLPAKVEIIEGAHTWLFGRPELIDGDLVHPNDDGQDRIANFVFQGVHGKSTRLNIGRFLIGVGPTAGYSNSDCYGYVEEGVFHLFGGLTKTVNGSAATIAYLDKPINIPAWLAPGVTRYIPLYTNGGNNMSCLAWVPTIASPGQTTVDIQIRATQGTLSNQILFPEISWPIAG